MSLFKMSFPLMAAVFLGMSLACDPDEITEIEQDVRSLTVQCSVPASDAPLRMNAEFVSEAEAERRMSEAQGSAVSYECWSSDRDDAGGASEVPLPSPATDLIAPLEAQLAGFCIPVCCSGKAICFPQEKN